MPYLWRAVDQECEVLESYVTKTRDNCAFGRICLHPDARTAPIARYPLANADKLP